MSNKDLTKHIGEDHFAEHVGIVLEVVKPGYARATMKIKPYHLNGVGRVQAGAIYTLADYTFAAAASTEVQRRWESTTISSIRRHWEASSRQKPEGVDQNKICGYDVDVFDETGNESPVSAEWVTGRKNPRVTGIIKTPGLKSCH